MSKKRIVVISLAVVVGIIACAGMGILRLGESIYRRSGGERGWSLGVSAYRMLGWGAEAYEEDFGHAHLEDAEEGECAGEFKDDLHIGRHFGHRGGRFGHGPFRFLGGLGCLMFLALLAIPGALLYRHLRKGRSDAAQESTD
jgi:hypothetical protein